MLAGAGAGARAQASEHRANPMEGLIQWKELTFACYQELSWLIMIRVQCSNSFFYSLNSFFKTRLPFLLRQSIIVQVEN